MGGVVVYPQTGTPIHAKVEGVTDRLDSPSRLLGCMGSRLTEGQNIRTGHIAGRARFQP